MSDSMPAVSAQSPVPAEAHNHGLAAPAMPLEASMRSISFADQGPTGPAAPFAHGGGDQSPLTVPPMALAISDDAGCCGYEAPLPTLNPVPPAVISSPMPSESTAPGVKAGPNDYSVVLT